MRLSIMSLLRFIISMYLFFEDLNDIFMDIYLCHCGFSQKYSVTTNTVVQVLKPFYLFSGFLLNSNKTSLWITKRSKVVYLYSE